MWNTGITEELHRRSGSEKESQKSNDRGVDKIESHRNARSRIAEKWKMSAITRRFDDVRS